MSLGELVLAKGTGAAPPFTVKDGNVLLTNRIVLQWFNDKAVLIPVNARAAFTTGEHHAHFDALLIVLTQAGIGILYPDTIASFMDPKARFADWLNGKAEPTAFGIDLTKAELAIPAAYATAKAKFVAMFTPPKPPRILDTREIPKHGKLVLTPGGTRVGNGSYDTTLTRAKSLWKMIDPLWKDTAVYASTARLMKRSTLSRGYTNETVRIFSDRVEIGCQSIQRNVAEQFAIEQGWLT